MRVVIAVIALTLVSSSARAGDIEKAKAHFKTGLAAFTLGDYAKAAVEYEAAYAEAIDPALLYNAAQAHRLAGNKPRALFLYQNYLRYFPTQSNRAEVQRHIENLQAAIEAEQKAKTTPPTESRQPSESKPPQPSGPATTAPAPTAPAPATTAPATTAPATTAPAPTAPAPATTAPATTAPATTAGRPSVAPNTLTAEAPPPPRKKTPKWVWGVVGGAAALVAVGLGVGLGVGLSGTSYPNADIGSGRLH